MATLDKRDIGLIPNKFIVQRTDGTSKPGGKHDGCSYFVLDLDHDLYAIPALEAYAIACEDDLPRLAGDLRDLIAGRDLATLQNNIEIDPVGDTIEIHGIKYAGQLFRSLGGLLPTNTPFQVVRRDDGVLTIEDLRGDDESPAETAGAKKLDPPIVIDPEDPGEQPVPAPPKKKPTKKKAAKKKATKKKDRNSRYLA